MSRVLFEQKNKKFCHSLLHTENQSLESYSRMSAQRFELLIREDLHSGKMLEIKIFFSNQ